jgi:hypothetical protein
MRHHERCPACAAKLPPIEGPATEHPDDRSLRLKAEADAKKTIGPFWRKRWRAFVALVQTYADLDAHEQLEVLRGEFWGVDLKAGPAPTAPRATDDNGKETSR